MNYRTVLGPPFPRRPLACRRSLMLLRSFALLLTSALAQRAGAQPPPPTISITDLGTLGGGYSEATAINEQGQVVGRSTTASGEYHGIVWHNGHITDLGSLGFAWSQVTDINEQGQVVGFSDTAR